MIQMLQRWSLAFMVMTLGFTTVAALPTQTAYAASQKCQTRFLTFPAWYDGLLNKNCDIKKPSSDTNGGGIGTFIWRIALNVIEMALQVVAYLSAGYLIYGGFRYLTSSGLPDKTAAAKKTILNAIIGLIISFMSVMIVTLVASGIKP